MIEATCTACGTVNRIADADVPVGAKFVNCASCKSRVGIPAKSAAGAPPPTTPGSPLDLADLPAPRRHSPLAGEAAKPAPRSGLAAASADAELPAPRSKKPSPVAAAPVAPPPGALDLDDLLSPPDAGADLLAPRPKSQQSTSDLPAPKMKDAVRPGLGGGRAMTDLPVPGIADTSPLADLPSPKPKSAGLADLPAPRPKMPVPAVPKLPAPPQPAASQPPMQAKGAPPGITDLPGPKPKMAPLTDLPGPKPKPIPAMPPVAAKPPGIVDLPTPRPAGGIVDLPMPKPGQISDLPMPKPGQPGDLPMPKPGQAGDLPAPKGFFEDLPQPARGGAQPKTTDVAPKGFFDDLPQPAKPGQQTNDVAPKGFFDDLPGRTNQQKPEVPAPKGFFDDLPGRTNQQKPEVPAPKGFFDDLPKPAAAKSRESQELEPAELSNSAIELDMGDAQLELANDPLPEPPPARIKQASVAPAPTAGPSNQFDDLDLSTPSPVSFQKGGRASGPGPAMPGGQVATINPAAAAAAAAAVRPAFGPKTEAGALELEEPRVPAVKQTPGKLGPKQREEQRQAKAVANTQQSARRRKIGGIALVVVMALGGGGYFAYRHFAKKAAHEESVNEQLGAARKAIAASQWSKASIAANKTLELEEKHAEALGIRAESLFVLGILEGNNEGRFGVARKSLADALEAGVTHPALERAHALSPLAAGEPDKAITKLKALVARAPKDAALQLYLGWAYAAVGDFENAVTAFAAAAVAPTVKVHALFGSGRAKQVRGDLAGARADYAAVLEVQKDHIGAQVGLASARPAQEAQQQEAELLAILALKDVEKKEPRAAMLAWILTAELARKGGRLDVARERYRKALAIQAQDVGALTGLAVVELRDGKLDVAVEMIDKAMKSAPSDMNAALVAVDIAIAKKQYEDAAKRLETLAKRTPPPPILDQSRIKGLEGSLLEAQGKEQDAIEAYLESAKLAGEQDLTPTLTAAAKLTAFADKAAAANDSARESELRKKADELLSALSELALKDPTLALTLGMAYLQANDPVKAEMWLRKAIELQPKHVDAMYQLAKALTRQGKDAEAISILRNAVELDPTRTEIGLELARTYEDARPPRDADAEKLYDKLLAAKEDTPIELRARAGRFFARIGQAEKAGEQGVAILKAQDDHPAGLYLKGEGFLKANKTDAARKLFVQASDADDEPQYWDARGRADEAWSTESGNTTYQDDALRSYAKAVEKDPSIFTSWIGQGRLYVVRKEDAKAIDPLMKAWGLKHTAEVARLLGIAVKNINAQPKVAADWLEQSYALEPHPDTAFNLGFLYVDARINDPKKAIAAYQRATELALAVEKDKGTPPAWLPEALYQLGSINEAQDNRREAKRAWEKWLQRNPKQDARYKEVKTKMATSLRDL